MMRKAILNRRSMLLGCGGTILVGCVSVPPPTGGFAVGRTSRLWRDAERLEQMSQSGSDVRELPVEVWYPAIPGTGTKTGYFPGLDKISKSLEASGEVSSFELFGLQFATSSARMDAAAAKGELFPVLLLSPGNGTNVQFYHGLASDLASRGFVVFGVNHPYDVAATALENGEVAQFVQGPLAFQQREPWIAERVRQRVADLLFLLRQLEQVQSSDPILQDRLALNAIGALGHSLGGITAAQAAYADSRIRACLNLDGLQRGGPFATAPVTARPAQPFMMITKEAQFSPPVMALLRADGAPAYVVVIAGASHNDFSDGGALTPLNSKGAGVLRLTSAYACAFFQQALQGHPADLLRAPHRDAKVRLDIYPSPPSG